MTVHSCAKDVNLNRKYIYIYKKKKQNVDMQKFMVLEKKTVKILNLYHKCFIAIWAT